MDATANDLRFGFGKNWRAFVTGLNDEALKVSESSLTESLGSIEKLSVLDIGCGSGLFSLAAQRLGAARIHSFDYDPDSVACTRQMKDRFAADATNWTTERGSTLDSAYLSSLGTWDIVYAWGVLHHTGDMWRAFDLVKGAVADGGRLFIAIYNDQGWKSRVWRAIKRTYVRSPGFVQAPMRWGFFALFASVLFVADAVRGRDPRIRHNGRGVRGMRLYPDVVDWIGGYPFEVATPAAIVDYFRKTGFVVERQMLCGRKSGCNQFLLSRPGGDTFRVAASEQLVSP